MVMKTKIVRVPLMKGGKKTGKFRNQLAQVLASGKFR